MSNLWRRKLAAYLHDPPEKAYDYGPRHKERARIHAESLGVADLWDALAHSPDWNAAAADRFVFPDGIKLGRSIGTSSLEYRHPMGGAGLPTEALRFPDAVDAEKAIADIRPDWKAADARETFVRVWRNWLPHAAEHAAEQHHGAALLPYLPADTRIPDSTIWHHNAIVSAFEATRDGDEPRASLRPAFFLFQASPVQEFISQARSTRDLWSGSYLLSWLTMHAIKAVADELGPDAIIFPSLFGQPLYDFLEPATGRNPHQNDVLLPSVPNRFLAIVRDDFEGEKAAKAFRDEWNAIAETCLQWLRARGLPFDEKHEARYRDQVRRYWHLAWQIWPWQSVPEALQTLSALPGGGDLLVLARQVAMAIPREHRDERCYRETGGELSPGWAWSAHYQICQYELDARRAVREFEGLPTDPAHKPALCDAFSGREEAVVEEDALQKIQNKELLPLFRHPEPLGAANLIKRVWHVAYLARLKETNIQPQPGRNLARATESFDSVPSIAAASFVAELTKRTEAEGALRERWLDFIRAASDAREEYPNSIAKFENLSEEEWLRKTDYSVFHVEQWDDAIAENRDRPDVVKRLRNAQAALKRLQKEAGASPCKYYAVLAMDGDEMGKWLSGAKSPSVAEMLAPAALDYFRTEPPFRNVGVDKWLESPRPISPSWHLQLSEALANFGLYAARRIVEEVHHGQLIYSGGDDVLAMVPADRALLCARDLRAAWQGRYEEMSSECRAVFRRAPEGFIWLAKPKGGKDCSNEPTWPLLVPGPRSTVSVGIAIGHYSESLQEMVRAAQAAEKMAKRPPEKRVFNAVTGGFEWKPDGGWGRDAVAVTLFKRSGETLHWGTKFAVEWTEQEGRGARRPSAAWPLLEYLWAHYRAPWGESKRRMPIGNRFPYRLVELAGRYGDVTLEGDIPQILRKEVEYVIGRQTMGEKEIRAMGLSFSQKELLERCDAYLEELASFGYHRAGAQFVKCPRRATDFLGLFLVEAFISRQAEERS